MCKLKSKSKELWHRSDGRWKPSNPHEAKDAESLNSSQPYSPNSQTYFSSRFGGFSWPYAEAPVSGHHPKSCTDFYLSLNMVIKKGWKPGRTSIYQFSTSRDCYPVFPQVRVVPVQNYLKYTSDSWHWVEAYQTPGNILQNLYWFSTNLIAQ